MALSEAASRAGLLLTNAKEQVLSSVNPLVGKILEHPTYTTNKEQIHTWGTRAGGLAAGYYLLPVLRGTGTTVNALLGKFQGSFIGRFGPINAVTNLTQDLVSTLTGSEHYYP